MRFALIVSDLSGGGAEKAMLNMAALLSGHGHLVDLVLLEDKCEHVVPPGMGIQALAAPGKISHGWFGKRFAAWKLHRLLRGGDGYHLIVSTLPFADEIVHLARLPRHCCRIANTLTSEIERLASDNPTRAARRRRRYLTLYRSHQLIAVSQGVADDMRTHFGIDTKQLHVIANPFDFAAIRVLAAAPCPNRPGEPYILHVGRFAPQKRHDLLLAAYARAELTQRLVLLTPPDARLEALIAQLGLQHRVTIADFQVNPYTWMAGADLLVLCSDHEGLPNVLIEALACGTRVISTNCPSGPSEILSGELAQWLVPCNNEDSLAQAMQVALAAPKPGAEAVAAALAPYSAERALATWEALARESSSCAASSD